MSLKKIQPGAKVSRFPAGTFNQLIAGELRDRQAKAGPPPDKISSAKSPVIVRLKLEGETPVMAGAVVALTSVLVTPEVRSSAPYEGLQFNCEIPPDAYPYGHTAITLGPIEAGGIGYGHMAPAAWVKLNVIDIEHEFALPQAGESELATGAEGFPIIWKEATGTGAGKWAVVKLETSVADREFVTSGELIDATLFGSPGPEGLVVQTLDADPEAAIVSAINLTGHPIFKGHVCTVLKFGEVRYIIATHSPTILSGVYDGVGETWEVESYDLSGAEAEQTAFDATGVTNVSFNIYDPMDKLTDLEEDDVVIFTTGSNLGTNCLNVIGTSRGGGGGGDGFPWPGPGTDPNPGTATVSIITAKVNEPLDVGSGDASFDFDSGTAIIGTATATGTAANTFGKGYCDNEDVLLISTNGAGWETLKVGVNIILATVDESGGVATTDGTFDFDGAVALEGQVPSGSAGIADNDADLPWANNEQFWAIQKDNGNWWPIKIPKVNIILATVNQSGGVRPADATYAFDAGAAITGVGPATGTANNTFLESYADNEKVTLIQRADNGEWETLKKGDCFLVCKGTPSTGITRSSSTITCSAPTVVQGKIPVGAIEAINNPELKAWTSDTIYFVFDLSAGTTNANRWTTAHTRNHILRLRGYTGYAVAAGEYQGFVHGDDETMRWMNCTICNPA